MWRKEGSLTSLPYTDKIEIKKVCCETIIEKNIENVTVKKTFAGTDQTT